MHLKVEELVEIPEGCTVTIAEKVVTVVGKKGTVTKDLSHMPVYIDIADTHVRCRLWNARRVDRSKVITAAKLIKNMITGACHGFLYKLKSAYKHFPIAFEVSKDGKFLLVKNFLGEKSIRCYKAIGDSVIRLGETKDIAYIEGVSLDDVSQLAGRIQNDCRPKNLDNRVFQDGVYIAAKGVADDI
ncbi:60S ribosomal protein L9-B [Dictyocoela roeselum]|nr:60S ribosomal protein L9-B [Dictyocoela roeselum]